MSAFIKVDFIVKLWTTSMFTDLLNSSGLIWKCSLGRKYSKSTLTLCSEGKENRFCRCQLSKIWNCKPYYSLLVPLFEFCVGYMRRGLVCPSPNLHISSGRIAIIGRTSARRCHFAFLLCFILLFTSSQQTRISAHSFVNWIEITL